MRNMNSIDLPTKMLTFDMKGSTVDREVIKAHDIKKFKYGSDAEKQKLGELLKSLVLKDRDFINLELGVCVSKSDANLLRNMINSDSAFLKSFQITDYSLLLTVFQIPNVTQEDLKNDIKRGEITKQYCSNYRNMLGNKRTLDLFIINY